MKKSDRAGRTNRCRCASSFKNFEETVESINANSKIVGQINEEDSWSKSKIYLQFYREVSGLREYAQVDLYDKTGKCIYTTAQEMPEQICRYTGAF